MSAVLSQTWPPPQSLFTVHSTQELVLTSHAGVAPLQALAVASHTAHVPPTQAGVAARCVQSALTAQASQTWLDALHAAALALGQCSSS